METNEPGSATKPVRCTSYPKSYLDDSSPKKHVKNKSSKSYTCEKCLGNNGLDGKKYIFKSNRYLIDHLFNVHKEKTAGRNYFKCEICSLEFSSRSKLETHAGRKHADVVDKAFECPVCSKTFVGQVILNNHLKRHDMRPRFFCDVCSKEFKAKQNCIRHLELKHNKLFYCHKCSRSFTNRSAFDEHLVSKSSLICQVCSKKFNKECDLDFHTNCHFKEIQDKAQDDDVVKPDNKSVTDLEPNLKFQCNLCSKNFDRETYFRAHRKLEHPHAEWTCSFSQCSKTFKTYHQFRLDQLRHSGTRPFVCQICQKSFFQSKKLKEHQQLHLQQRKYKCNKCPKSFTIPSLLNIHVANQHGGPKPFKCPFKNCETSWANHKALKSHLASHRVKKLFNCEMCSKYKAFKELRNLKRHQRDAHHDYKDYKPTTQEVQNSSISKLAVFNCCLKKCSFQTVNEKDIAIHHYQQHQLPQILLFRNCF